jgi:bifunctional non-homologous end joining protein LigD
MLGANGDAVGKLAIICEIKYDGYQMMLIRGQDRGRLISRGGRDWADRFPLIVAAALKPPQESFVLDGEVVVLRPEGVSDFDALSSRKQDKRAMLYAFDPLASEDDLRGCRRPSARIALAQLLEDPVDGMFIAEYERSAIRAVLFKVACNMGLEGIVSKHLDRPDGAGRCRHWIEINNPARPAYGRVRNKLLQCPHSRRPRSTSPP